MKNKIITTILSIIFIMVFSYYNFSEYKDFHNETKTNKINSKIVLENVENFKIEDIKEINNIELYYTPYRDLANKIIEKINFSEKNIFLEAYMLTHSGIIDALIKAKKRGVKIHILLEKSPYKTDNINNKAFEKLKKAGINIKWGDKDDYSLNHSKVLIIDDLSIISTGNFTYSTFKSNKDFFIFTFDENINKKLRINFFNDFEGKKINIFDENLIFSPNTSRIKFEKLFEKSEKSIQMYFQYFKDDKLVNKLIEIKKNKDIKIQAIVSENAKDDKNVKILEKNGINIKIYKKSKMHAKAILIDEQYLFIGSINFSNYSIDSNREIGIILKNKKIVQKFIKIFNKDFK